MKRYALTIFPALVFASQLAIAHPGHGNKELDGYSILHYALEPLHLLSSLFVIILVVAVIRKVHKVRTERIRKK